MAKVKGGSISSLDPTLIISMYRSGVSTTELSRIYGVYPNGILYILEKHGVKRRASKRGSENHFSRGGARRSNPAIAALNEAIGAGRVTPKEKCEVCGGVTKYKDGKRGVQAHHDDYNKPLDVRWLCFACHHEWHKHNTAILSRDPVLLTSDEDSNKRAIEYLANHPGFNPIKSIAEAIWPLHKMTGHRASSCARLVLKRLESQGKVMSDRPSGRMRAWRIA